MDQLAWKANATWVEAPFSLADLWRWLMADDLPGAFRASVATISETHPLLKRARRAAETGSDAASVTGVPKPRFLNLPSGTFTEVLFDRTHREQLTSAGIYLDDNRSVRSFIDFTLTADAPEGFRLPINTKNAGVAFREAAKFTGLSPEDTIPVAAYKAFGSEAAEPLLLYVFLIDWDLLSRLRSAYWGALSASERRVFRLLACTMEMARNLEDAFMTATVEGHFDQLRSAAGYGDTRPDFRVVSAARIRSYLFLKRERTPGVFKQQLGTEPAVHVSIANETTPFDLLVDQHLSSSNSRLALIDGLLQTTVTEAPDPIL